MRAAVLLFIMVVLTPLSFLMPFAGLLTFTWMSYVRPHEWAYDQSAKYSLAIVVVTILGFLVFELPRRIPPVAINLLLILLWVQLTLSTLMARSTNFAMPKYQEYSKILFMALLTTAMVTTEKRVWLILLVLLGSIGLVVAKSFVGIVIRGGNTKIYGVGGALGDNNDIALLLAMTIPILFYFSGAQEKWWLKWGFYALTLMSVIVTLFTYSRGGLLGMLVGIGMIILKSRYKTLTFVLVVLLAVPTWLVLPRSLKDRFLSIQGAEEKDKSAQQRLKVWGISLEIIRDHPLMGVGIRNILLVTQRYSIPGGDVLVSHNAYLQMATDAGIPALLLFLALIGVSWLRLRKTRGILKIHAPDSPLIKYCHGMEASLPAYMTSAIFASRQDLELFYLVVALASSMILIARQYELEAEARDMAQKQALTRPRYLQPDFEPALAGGTGD
ncbi:MAG: putative O-glycosylation ligase, exosortase A system-associated [Blastocatellia bacterium]